VRRDVLYAGATAVGLGVLVLAGVGVVSLVDDDRSLNRDEARELIEARQFSLARAAEITTWWARANKRPGEDDSRRGCAIASQSRPYRYSCTVALRDRAGRYRGFELTLAEGKEFVVKIVRVRPRRAGPAGAPQQP
jgi:hypothetical protein